MLKRPCISAIEVGYRYSPLSFLVSFINVDMDISSLIIYLETCGVLVHACIGNLNSISFMKMMIDWETLEIGSGCFAQPTTYEAS